jgi:hypothetical protein
MTNTKKMQRYIILNQGYPPFLTDYYDPENHEPAEAIEQIVIDLATTKYRQNFGENAGQWIEMEEDHL